MMGVVWCVMNVLGEIVSYLPLKGLSIPYFVDRFVDPSLAFATGWNYWSAQVTYVVCAMADHVLRYAYAILVAAEATAGAIILDYCMCKKVAVWFQD